MIDPESQFTIAQAQHADRLCRAQEQHRVGHLRRRSSVVRGAARLAGQALLTISTWLLRYAQVDRPTVLQLDRAPHHSTSLN